MELLILKNVNGNPAAIKSVACITLEQVKELVDCTVSTQVHTQADRLTDGLKQYTERE